LSVNVLLSLSVAISSPILAFNILFRSPLPIPVGLFDTRTDSSLAGCHQKPNVEHHAREYKRSGSVTVVEGRRSGDLWLSNGDAVDGKTKFGRAIGMLAPAPKLSVLPLEESDDNGRITPPLPLRMDDSASLVDPTPRAQNNAELGRMRSLASFDNSVGDESIAHATQIMIAQKHYSTPALTVVVPASLDHGSSVVDATGAAIDRPTKGHLRARSISLTSGTRPQSAKAASSPPLSSPPTLKNTRRAKMGHNKSFSTGAVPLNAIDYIYEIDAMTAGLLPRLVPGLKVGDDMKIRDNIPPAGAFNAASKKKLSPEFGVPSASREFSSPELHSTPAQRKEARSRNISGHKRNGYSLPG
jgi:hypothetical protein